MVACWEVCRGSETACEWPLDLGTHDALVAGLESYGNRLSVSVTLTGTTLLSS